MRPLSARAISDSVPDAPPTAMTASAAPTTRALRTSPRPVGSAICTHSLASRRSVPGRIPITVAPASRAPPRGPPHAAAPPAGDDDAAGRPQATADVLGGLLLLGRGLRGADDR